MPLPVAVRFSRFTAARTAAPLTPSNFAASAGVKESPVGSATGAASPEKINALVVRDAKQPRRQRLGVIEGLKLPVGVKKGVLNDVLAIENGANHP